jgi:D-beta-D-heptose 7-phosphate kinase/D-beta-D-heptose 1-phosphate adenosyltransferase
MYLSESRLAEIFEAISSLEIAVIGDVMLDRYLWGDAERISPEAPVPVIDLIRDEIRIGGAANVADNLTVLGAKPWLISIIGDDEEGRQFVGHSDVLGLNTDLVMRSSNRPTTVKTRIMARHQQVCRVDREFKNGIRGKDLDGLIERFDSVSSKVSAVIISDYGKGVVTPALVGKIVDYCRSNSSFVTVDPKDHHWEYYAGVDLIKPNNDETTRATGIPTDNEADLERAGWSLLEITKAKAALITTGERGMSLFDRGKSVRHLPTMAHDVFDVTGAGDTVIAVATAALAAGASFDEAAIIANHAAGVVVAEVGTAAATHKEIAASMVREGRRNGSNR